MELHLKPRISPGVAVHQSNDLFVEICSPHRWRDALVMPATIAGADIRSTLRVLDGKRSITALATLIGIPLDSLTNLLSELATHGLVDLKRTPIPYQDRYNPAAGKIESVRDVESLPHDPAVRTFIDRFEIESKAFATEPDVIDGGRASVLARRNFSVLIFGSDRIATSLLPILGASGFSNLRLTNRASPRHPSQRVSGTELLGTFLRSSDIGQLKGEHLEELRREYSLFEKNSAMETRINLVIATEIPPADQLQRWMNEQTPHLLIQRGHGGIVRIGPLVLPGKTPCLRCVELAQPLQEFLTDCEIPESSGAMTALAIGVIAADLARFVSDGSSHFLATTIDYAPTYLASPYSQKWLTHHNCGCLWR